MTESGEQDPAQVILEALRLKRERVVSDDYDFKLKERAALDEAVDMMKSDVAMPSAGHLRQLLGDPDDARIRHALDAWEARI